MNFEKDNNQIKRFFVKKIFNLIFVNTLIFYLIYYLIELVADGFVTRFYNLNYQLLFVIGFGVLAIGFNDLNKKVIDNNELKKTNKSQIFEFAFVIVVTIITGLTIYYKTRDIGGLSILISGLFVLLMFLVSYFVLSKNK